MKKYSYNKNFIPASFIEKYKRDTKKKNISLLILISIIELILLPKTMSFILSNNNNRSKKNNKEDKIIEYSYINNESFFKWMDIIKDDTVGTFNENEAIIFTDSIDEFQGILKDKRLKIINMEAYDDKYKIRVIMSEG
ncbi:hypothetical protein SAMN04487886_100158 [Clostridium sp. DSM 8431]|uniref:hypothetical protein n=1 Tax=Clostridium sp. DSM 8431 TaxID=1761781 RepID=UPI0008E4978A|nr:hypothetical protein [Clostridium sp. DSM 8431]SFU28654.1 hypothetical protein SAMN04487886_100158 [Clostridium sp. DSM 8431]